MRPSPKRRGIGAAALFLSLGLILAGCSSEGSGGDASDMEVPGPEVLEDLDEAVQEYLRCFRDPATIHATCEDYRASASIDLEHDAADRTAGRKLRMPLLVLWGARNPVVGGMFDTLAEWREISSITTQWAR